MLLVIGVGLWMGITHFDTLLAGWYGVLNLFRPILLGFCIAFIVNVLMVPVEAIIAKSGLKRYHRALAMLLSLLIVGVALFVLVLMIVPAFSEAISDIIIAMPEFWTRLQAWFNTLAQSDNLPFDVAQLPNIDFDTKEIFSWVGNFLSVGGSTVVNATLDITGIVLGTSINLLLGLVFAIYGLAQKETLAAQTVRLLHAMMPENRVKEILRVAKLTEKSFSNFIRGQLTEAFVIGFLCFVGMLILRIPHAVAVSVLVGVTALIPVFGAIIGIALGAFLIVMVTPIKALWFILFIIVLQQLESNLIYPKVVGDSIGLPGIWVLMAVTIGAGTFGILGMLFGVPLASVVYALVGEWIAGRLKSKKVRLPHQRNK